VKLCIRYYSKKDIPNDDDNFNLFAMNYVYSEPTTTDKVTFPVKLGRFGDASNIVSVKMSINPLTPKILSIRYNSKLGPWARVYFNQPINATEQIKDYEWSNNKGVTWTAAGLNLSVPITPLNTSQLGFWPKRWPEYPIMFFDINVSNKSTAYTIMIRAVTNNTNQNEPSSAKTTNTLSIKEWYAMWDNRNQYWTNLDGWYFQDFDIAKGSPKTPQPETEPIFPTST
jgi:hypothetical protein